MIDSPRKWWYYLITFLSSQDMELVRKMPVASNSNSSKLAAADRILQAAKMLFAQSGFENTSTISIARLAQTSESQIIKHFGSKEGLLEAIFEEGWKHIGEAFGALEYVPSPSSKLQALVGLILTKLEEDEQLKELLLLEGRRIRREGQWVLMTLAY